MCLSTVYKVTPMGREKICEYVSSVKSQGDSVLLTDIMGLEKTVRGTIRSLDLVNNEIILEPKEA